MTTEISSTHVVLIVVGPMRLAIPATHVLETMRPLSLRWSLGESAARATGAALGGVPRVVRAGASASSLAPASASSRATEAASFLRGVALIRGEPVAVVHLGTRLGLVGAGAVGPPTAGARYVLVSAGTRRIALEVDEVIGVRSAATLAVDRPPPLLSHVHPDVIQAIGRLDDELLVILDATRILDEGESGASLLEGAPTVKEDMRSASSIGTSP